MIPASALGCLEWGGRGAVLPLPPSTSSTLLLALLSPPRPGSLPRLVVKEAGGAAWLQGRDIKHYGGPWPAVAARHPYWLLWPPASWVAGGWSTTPWHGGGWWPAGGGTSGTGGHGELGPAESLVGGKLWW